MDVSFAPSPYSIHRELTSRVALADELWKHHVRDSQALAELRAQLDDRDAEPTTHVSELSTVTNRPLAAMLLGVMASARSRGIRVEVDERTQFGGLRSRLDDTSAVTVVSNLIDNACDAVERMPRSRRRVDVLLSDLDEVVRIRVSDLGGGLAAHADDLVRPGFSTKPGHSGLGLALVSQVVARAGGNVVIAGSRAGTIVDIRIPS